MSLNFKEAEAYIMDIPRFTSKNSQKATRAFLEKTGDLSLSIPTVHVAGTNGKGSVCAYLRAGLNAAGLSAGVFTSPHLVNIRERFAYNDEMITEEEFADSFNEVATMVEEFRKENAEYSEYHPTFFEYLFFMSMIWYGKRRPDVLILETGLGGRLDATNSISSPKVCVITEIGLDHMEYLGATKELIAGEKAGIIKEGVPVVVCEREDEPGCLEVIKNKAREMNSECVPIGRKNIKNFKTTSVGIDFSIQSLYDNCADFSLYTRAYYQAENASLAYTAIELLKKNTGLLIDLCKVRNGFTNMKWPGRMEEVLPGLVIDGAHNEDGIKAFLESVSKDGAGKRSLIYSAVSDKQIEVVAGHILASRLFDTIYVSVLSSYRAADLARLKNAFCNKGDTKIVFCDTIRECLDKSLKDSQGSVLRYVAGSLYLVGEVKELISSGEKND